jgi:hypothetical protein
MDDTAPYIRQYYQRYYPRDPTPAPPSQSTYYSKHRPATEVSAHGAVPAEGAEFSLLTEDSVKRLGKSTGGQLWRLEAWAKDAGISVYSQEFLDEMRKQIAKGSNGR